MTRSNARNYDRKSLGPHKHLSGQKLFGKTHQEMEEELGRPVSIGEVFIRKHTKPNGTYVDLKSQQVIAAYKKNLQTKLSDIEEENSETLEGTSQHRQVSTDEDNKLFLKRTSLWTWKPRRDSCQQKA